MKFHVLMMLLLLLVSCNQNGLGAGGVVKNFFTAPIQGISSLFTNADYKEKREATLKKEGQEKEGELEYCIDQTGHPINEEALSSIDQLSKKVRKTACRCSPWGNCPISVCSCDTQCPKGFDIFRHPADVTPEKLSNEKNGLAFRNSSIPSKYEQTQGYCWGHARLTSQFNRLAFFKPEAKPPYNIDSDNYEEQQDAIEYYKTIIDKVDDNQAVNIPGFTDLQTLSDHPALQSYMADKVAKGWAKQAMSWQGLKTGLGGEKKSNQEYKKLFQEVKERIDMNMQPTIVFTGRGSKFYTHATLVSHYETMPDGQLKLCLRDNNNSELNASACADHMTIHPEKGLVYSDPMWGPIGSINVAHNENADSSAQAESLRKKCLSEKDCPLK